MEMCFPEEDTYKKGLPNMLTYMTERANGFICKDIF